VLSHVKLLPAGISATSMQGLDMLGLVNAHMRICPLASREMIRTLSSVPGLEVRSIDTSSYARQFELTSGWSHSHRLHWPKRVSVVVRQSDGKLFGPLFTRQSHEGWKEESRGALLQFDTKLAALPQVSLSAYLPFVVDSFSWRYSPDGIKLNHRFAKLLDSGFTDVKQVVVRPAGFFSKPFRESKEFFMAMVNSNCGGTGIPVVRELFSFAVGFSFSFFMTCWFPLI